LRVSLLESGECSHADLLWELVYICPNGLEYVVLAWADYSEFDICSESSMGFDGNFETQILDETVKIIGVHA
jgi:hypothetical protein